MDIDPLEGVLDIKDAVEDRFTERESILGLPIGPQRTDWSKIAKVGAGAAAAVAAATAAVKALRDSDGAQQAIQKGKEAVEDAVEQGGELLGDGEGLSESLQQAGGQLEDLAGSGEDLKENLKEKAASLGDAVSGDGSLLERLTSALGGLTSGDDEDDEGPVHDQRLIISEQVDVAVPRPVAYNQWTQFEDFPHIFQGVQRVQQEDDDRTQWTGKILFASREWEAEILEQAPDERIVWETSGDVEHRGVVTFHRLDDNLTRVQIEMEYTPTGVLEKVGNLFLTARHRVRKDLRLFKHYLELRGEETGAWRGEIADGEVHEPSDDDDDDAGGGQGEDQDDPPRDESGRFVSEDEQEEAEAG